MDRQKRRQAILYEHLVSFFLFGIILLYFSDISLADPFTCTFTASCTGTALLDAKNDTSGFTNAHADNLSEGFYSNVLCCTPTNANLTLVMDCNAGSSFLHLENLTNSHVQIGSYSGPQDVYNNSVCISAYGGTADCTYPSGSCASGYTCLASIASSNLTNGNQTDAHIGPCGAYDLQVCCNVNGPNTPPTTPVLLEPEDLNQTLNRNPLFVWNVSYDLDGDAITYTLNITCYALSGGSCPGGSDDRLLNVSTNATTFPQELLYFIDDGFYYNWTVLATDQKNDSAWAEPRSINISTYIDISLLTANVDFGSKAVGQTDDTDDNSPTPFTLRNNGNVEIEVNLSENSTTSLFVTKPAPTAYYQFKVDNTSGEPGAFVWENSVTTYTNVPIVNVTAMKKFNYTDTIDEAQIDINITVPSDEPPGYKESTIEFIGYYVYA